MLGTTYFVVGFPSARSIAQDMVPLWSQPYASTPTVFPAHSRMCACLWIDLSKGRRPISRGALIPDGGLTIEGGIRLTGYAHFAFETQEIIGSRVEVESRDVCF
jgi:hypothetical protein